MKWRVLGKHFYEVSTREEGHVFTLLIYFVEFGAAARCTAGSSVCIYITLCNSISSSVLSHWCWTRTSHFVWFITKVYRKQLRKGLSGTVLRKRLHFPLSMWLVLVVWGPVQVLVFKSDVYQGTDCAGIIIMGLSEMSHRARMPNGKRQRFVLCFLTELQRGCFHPLRTCGPNQNGGTVGRKRRVFTLTTDWHRPELSYHSR